MSIFVHPWWRLLRVGNLLYLGILLFLLRYAIIMPLFAHLGAVPTLSILGFWCLVVSIIAAAAAGYVLNDVADIATDQINKPQRITVGQSISADTANNAGMMFNLTAIVSGFAAAYLAGNYKLGWIQVVCVLCLWQYARSWKKIALWGNIVVAGLAALAVLMPALFEQELFYTLKDQATTFVLGILGYSGETVQSPKAFVTGIAPTMLAYILPYSAFAFLLTLVREIVKDAEDIVGDSQANYRTLPIVGGMAWTKLAALIPLLLSIQLIARFMIRQLVAADYMATAGAFWLVLLPLLWFVGRLWKATDKPDFSTLSRWAKIIMALGLLYLPYLAITLPKMPISTALPAAHEATPTGLPEEVITDIKIDTIMRTGDLSPSDTNITEQPEIIIGKPQGKEK